MRKELGSLVLLALLASGCEAANDDAGGAGAADGGLSDADGAAPEVDGASPGRDAARPDAASPADAAAPDPDAAAPDPDAAATPSDAAAPDDALPPDARATDAGCELRRFYADQDDDGRGDPAESVLACEPPAGFVDNADDTQPRCATDDADVCGVCRGPGPGTWYADADGDGLGDPAESERACIAPAGYVGNAGDAEPDCATNDEDECGVCAGPGRPIWYADGDGDGLGTPGTGVRACIGPAGAVGNDDDPEPDCRTNDTDPCGVCAGPGRATWYPDADGDGLGDPVDPVRSCRPPAGHVANGDDPEPDCATNDTDDCGVCAGPGRLTWYVDLDGDGLGDPTTRVFQCERPEHHVDNGDDPEPACPTNDTDACGLCAGPGRPLYFRDADGDGLGDPNDRVRSCARPRGYVLNDDDLQPDCPTNDCNDCANGGRPDCAGVCNGAARLDRCGVCAGGTTGRQPNVADADADGFPDACDLCPTGAPARFIAQWTGIPPYDGRFGGPFTFQIVLHANGDVAVYYQAGAAQGHVPTVGLQGQGGAGAIDVPYDAARRTLYFRRQGDGHVRVDNAPFAWVDIRHSGTPVRLRDDGVTDAALPFPFPFAGASYGAVTISANGLLALSPPVGDYTNDPLPDAGLGAMVAALWMDLNPAVGGTVHFQHLAAGCAQDCAGDFGGSAFADTCGVCAGGSTGRSPDSNVDCNGDCNGDAYYDACGRCVGGNTGLAPLDEAACPRGPDLLVVRDYLAATLEIDYIDARDQCLIAENCIRGLGLRKVLRFGTRIANAGNADLQLGAPGGNDLWEFDQCHQHFHFQHYAAYDLFDVTNGRVLPIGAKNGFAVIDMGVYDPAIAPNGCRGYNGANQGITAGCYDTYSANISCQWIDVTDVPDGTYDVIVTTNPEQLIPELDYDNNASRVRVEMQGDELRVLD